MYRFQYTDKRLWEHVPATVSVLCDLIYKDSCENIIFSRMTFESQEAAVSVASDFAERIVEYVMAEEKRRCRQDRLCTILPFRVSKGGDGNSVSVEYYLRSWIPFATWTVVKDEGTYGRAQIVFLDKEGFRCTYEFDSLPDMFTCIKSDKYLAASQKILLVADEGIPIYSSLLYQPEKNFGAKRNKKQIRIVFRGEDGVRRTYDFDSAKEFFKGIHSDKFLTDKAEILLLANRGIAAYSSLAANGGLVKKAGLKEIAEWFSDTSTAAEN